MLGCGVLLLACAGYRASEPWSSGCLTTMIKRPWVFGALKTNRGRRPARDQLALLYETTPQHRFGRERPISTAVVQEKAAWGRDLGLT